MPQRELREVVAQVPAVAGKEPLRMQQRMRSDQEVWQHATRPSAAPDVPRKVLAGERSTLSGSGHELEVPVGQEFNEVLAVVEGRPNLRQHALADNHCAFGAGSTSLAFRGVGVLRGIGDDVEEDGAVRAVSQ